MLQDTTKCSLDLNHYWLNTSVIWNLAKHRVLFGTQPLLTKPLSIIWKITTPDQT